MLDQRDVLFGVIAAQLGRVSPAALKAAMADASATSASFADCLLRVGGLDDRGRKMLESFVREAVEAHDQDVASALESFGGREAVARVFGQDVLTTVADAETVAGPFLTDPRRETAGVEEFPGRYTRATEHATGGMGRILLVHDEVLGRDIALKELLPEHAGGPGASPTPVERTFSLVARFLKEARITSQLEHPSIVPVYELGHRSDGRLYYTMKLLRGRSLSSAIKETIGLRGRLALLPHFVDICQALAYAHSRGVIHRDIKPSNVMVGEFGETALIDWGLAKVRGADDIHRGELQEKLRALNLGYEQDLAKTAYGSAMGTPAYMPPEQARGDLDEIDERSDVYSLGAMLYELLTGFPPFQGNGLADILVRVVTERPIPIASREPQAPPELVAICERALHASPERRYQTASDLLEDVKRFQSGALVSSYRYTVGERIARVVRQNKGVFGTGAAAAIALAGVIATAFDRIGDERDIAAEERDNALEARALAEEARSLEQAARSRAEAMAYENGISLAARLVDGGDFEAAEEALWGLPERLRRWEWGRLLRRSNREDREITNPRGPIATADLSPDRGRIAFCGVHGGAIIVNAETGELVARLADGASTYVGAAFSPDGQRIVVGERARTPATIYELASGRPIQSLCTGDACGGYRLEFSRDGATIAQLADDARAVFLWRVADGQLLRRVVIEGEVFNDLAFDPAGTELALSGRRGDVHIVRADTGEVVRTLSAPHVGARSARFSPDGSLIVAGYENGHVVTWQRSDGAILTDVFSDRAAIWSIAIDDDGRRMASGDNAGQIFVRSLRTGALVAAYQGGSAQVYKVFFDGEDVIGVYEGGIAKTWGFRNERSDASFQTRLDNVRQVEFSPDGSRVLAVTTRKDAATEALLGHSFVQVIDASDAVEIAAFGGFTGRIESAVFSPDGRTLAVTAQKAVYILDSETGTIIQELRGFEMPPALLSFSTDGSLLASSTGNSVYVSDMATGDLLHAMKGPETTYARWIEFQPGGRYIAAGGLDGSAQLWDAESGQLVENIELPNGRDVFFGAFDRSGNQIRFADVESTLWVWDINERTFSSLKPVLARDVRTMTEHPAGDRIAVLSQDDTMHLLVADDGTEVLRARGSTRIYTIDWAPAGDTLVLGTYGGDVVFQHASPWLANDLPGDSTMPWRDRLELKRERELESRSEVEHAAVRQTMSTNSSQVSSRFTRWAEIVLTGDSAQPESDFLFRINAEAAEALTLFGLLESDVVAQIEGQIPASIEDAAALIAEASATLPGASIRLEVLRDGRNRQVEIHVLPQTRSVARSTLPRSLANVLLQSLPMARFNRAAIEKTQRDFSDPLVIAPRSGLDGIWVGEVDTTVSSPQASAMLTAMNRFFTTVELRVYDRILTINGVPLKSLEALLTAIEAGRDPIRNGEPYSYVLEVERSTFEIVELTIVVE